MRFNLKKVILISGMAVASVSAYSADGCKFLLCMGAPNPMGISECAPTVKEVLHDIRKGRGIPKCKFENGNGSESSGSYVTYYKTKVPTCPVGFTAYGRPFVKYHRGKPNSPDSAVNSKGITVTKNSRVCLKGAMNASKQPNGDYRHEWYDDVVKTYKDGKKYEFVTYIDGQVQSKHRF